MRYCTVKDCKNKHSAKGLCNKHYLIEYHKSSVSNYVKQKEADIHRSMLSRCYNPNNKGYKNYGGRGISVCDRWLGDDGFNNFIADMGRCPDKLSIDRIDNDKGYYPDNCRWTTYSIQNINKRLNSRNSSGYRGVHIYTKAHNRGWAKQWLASINMDCYCIHLGSFSTKEEAALAYDCASIQIYGDNANLNLLL